jgi:hypothetical protein
MHFYLATALLARSQQLATTKNGFHAFYAVATHAQNKNNALEQARLAATKVLTPASGSRSSSSHTSSGSDIMQNANKFCESILNGQYQFRNCYASCKARLFFSLFDARNGPLEWIFLFRRFGTKKNNIADLLKLAVSLSSVLTPVYAPNQYSAPNQREYKMRLLCHSNDLSSL